MHMCMDVGNMYTCACVNKTIESNFILIQDIYEQGNYSNPPRCL